VKPAYTIIKTATGGSRPFTVCRALQKRTFADFARTGQKQMTYVEGLPDALGKQSIITSLKKQM
jgi:hypothetical protein